MSKKMKIIEREEGDVIKHYYLSIELSDGREVEVTVIQSYDINPDFTNLESEIISAEDFTSKEIEEIKKFAEENYLEQN